MAILLTLVHYIVCIFLIIVVLLQSGKAADLAGAFGGMGSQTVFGPRGSATVLSKATTIAAVLFMFTSLSLSIIATRGGKGGPSVLDKAKAAPTQQQKNATPQPGSTVPLTMTPIGPNGEKGTPQTVPAPVAPAPAPAK
jgi:preprotein translocase subunit SecG